MESILDHANIFVTGGGGTLGRAIAERRKREGWTGQLTVFSRDTTKHSRMRSDYPDVNYVCGDIRNFDTLYAAMSGHSVVIHAAAVKVIPVSEYDSIDTIDVNVIGSLNVARAAVQLGVALVIGISTDKAAHPVNAYGCTKMLLEKIWQEYSRKDFQTGFYLCRYGNVLESTGSVIEIWKNAYFKNKPITITDDTMTRFFLSPSQAVQVIIDCVNRSKNGLIYVPRMPSLSIKKLAYYVLPGDVSFSVTGLRPGEKMHEDLVTVEETAYTEEHEEFFLISPTTDPALKIRSPRFASDLAREMTRDELTTLLENK